MQGQLCRRALLLSSSLTHPTQILCVADPCCQARLPLPPIKPAAPLQTGELRFGSLTCYPVAVTDCHVLPRGDRSTAPGDVICVQRFRVVILFEDTSAGKVLMQSSRQGEGSLASQLRLDGVTFPLQSSQARSAVCRPRQWLLYRQFLAEKR